jgi:hypothetical protein
MVSWPDPALWWWEKRNLREGAKGGRSSFYTNTFSLRGSGQAIVLRFEWHPTPSRAPRGGLCCCFPKVRLRLRRHAGELGSGRSAAVAVAGGVAVVDVAAETAVGVAARATGQALLQRPTVADVAVAVAGIFVLPTGLLRGRATLVPRRLVEGLVLVECQ